MRVASRIAAFQYKGKPIEVAEIGKRLNVATILEGSVRKAGNRLRITVQLTDVRDGYQLWSERYDRDLDDVFAIQDEIARAIVDKMRGQLARGDLSGIMDQRSRRRTEDPEAYQSYLRGRYHWNKRTPSSFQQAIGHFQAAVERDPGYALAYTGLSDTLNLLGYYNVLPPTDAYPKAKSASGRALQIDAELAEAHASRGFSQLMYDRDYAGSETSLHRAIDLDSAYASGHQWLAWVLFARDRFDEALQSVRKAAVLDPLSPVIGCHHAYALELLGRRGEAVEQLKTTLLLNPSFGLAHFHLGCLRLVEGRYDDAIQSLRTAVDASGGRIGVGYLGQAFGVAGRSDEARAVLAGLQSDATKGYTSPLDLALVHAGLGETRRDVRAAGPRGRRPRQRSRAREAAAVAAGHPRRLAVRRAGGPGARACRKLALVSRHQTAETTRWPRRRDRRHDLRCGAVVPRTGVGDACGRVDSARQPFAVSARSACPGRPCRA